MAAGILEQLKGKGIMAAIVDRSGAQVGSNFTLHEGMESYIASSFNVGDAFLREVGEEAKELVISTERGNLVLRDLGKNRILLVQIQTKEQYKFYKSLCGGEKGKEEGE